MQNHRAAVRYAKSLVELARERDLLDVVRDDMELFSKVFSENRKFAVILNNPIIIESKKRAILDAIFEGKMNDLSISLFKLITKKNRTNILDQIAASYLLQYNILKGIEVAEVTTTFKLDNKLKNEFQKVVKGIVNKDVNLDEKIDESLIGGYTLKIGDKQVDESLRSKLQRLKRELTV